MNEDTIRRNYHYSPLKTVPSKSTHLKSPRLSARYEYTEANDSAGHQISYEPASTPQLEFPTLPATRRDIRRLTDRVRPDGVRVDTEERDSDKRAIAPKTEDGVAELESSVVLVRVPLVEVDV